MASIIFFNPTVLRYEESLGFYQEVEAKVAENRNVKDLLPHQNFLAALLAFKASLDVGRSVRYQNVLDADGLMDQAITGLRAQLQPMMLHPNDEVREAAKIIWAAIEQYGSPNQLAPTEEHPIVNRMLDALDALDPTLLTKTLTKDWVDSIHQRYTDFMDILKRYDYERTHTSANKVKAAREAIYAAWQVLCVSINGLAVNSPSEENDALIEAINLRIQSRKSAMKMRRAARKNSISIPDPSDADPSDTPNDPSSSGSNDD